jgi:hypothetical protein
MAKREHGCVRRILAGALTILLLASALPTRRNIADAAVPELHGKVVDIYFNDILVSDWGDVLPFIDTVSGRTMVPLRFYSEKIGCQVEWLQKEKKITITYNKKDYPGNIVSTKVIILWVGNRKTSVDGNTVWLDSAPWQESKYPWRVYVPLRFVSSCLGDMVIWIPKGTKMELFPDVIVGKDTVMMAHFLPVPDEDYLIVPGERWGQFCLKMPLEQLRQLMHLTRIVSQAVDGKYGEYYYDFSVEGERVGVYFVSGTGITSMDDTGPLAFTIQYSVEGFPIRAGQWINLDGFLRDYPSDEKTQAFTIRGGEHVTSYVVGYNKGIQFIVWKDYLPQDRGYFVEFILIYPPKKQ